MMTLEVRGCYFSHLSWRAERERERRQKAMTTATTTTPAIGVSAFLYVPKPPPHKLQVACNKVIYMKKLPTFSIGSADTYPPHKLIPFLHFASTSSSPAVAEDQESIDDDELPLESGASTLGQDSETLSSVRGCKACGREETESGCNGEGRIQGGIATVPGFGWWPIKAFRPCPAYLATGGRYKRRGQSMDEVASGGIQKRASAANDDEA